MRQRPFRARLRSAVEGIAFAARSQANLRIQGAAAAGVLLLAWLLRLRRDEWLILLLTILLLLVAELMNTAVERAVDGLTAAPDPAAKAAKDVAAGAVLVAAVGAAAVGGAIFLPALGAWAAALMGWGR